jgi:cysteine desulfurase
MPKSNNRSTRIYLDYASSVSPNPSSIHASGVEAKKELQDARLRTAGILGARVSEIIFTSGGTESNNLAIQGAVLAWQGKSLPHIITTNIEHPSVLETFKMLEKRKFAQISIVPVETNGIVNPKKIKKEIKKNTVLVSVMYANNEIGTIQPIREIAKEIRHYKRSDLKNSKRSDLDGVFPLFHTDAVQAVNYLDLNVEHLGVDLLTLSGSKIEGAGRVGILYKKKSAHLFPIFGGGNQEGNLRPGTENLPAIIKFGQALQFTQKIKNKETQRLTKLRDYFFTELAKKLKNNFFINGDLKNRLPNNINITIPKIPSDLLVLELSARGIMASAKSACKSGDGKASHVIQAIRKDTDLSRRSKAEVDGSLRFSLGRRTSKKDIDRTIYALSEILIKLKKWYT